MSGIQATPSTDGWSGAAMAIHAVRRMSTPVLLRIDVVGAGTIAIDPRRHAYSGDLDLARLPEHPTAVVVETHPADHGDAGVDGPGRDLDGLLWRIGTVAFDDRPASWRWPGDRYRMLRWPNLGEIGAGPDDLRALAMLATTAATPEEVAAATGADRGRVERIVNALGLIGIVDSGSAAPPQPSAPVVQRRGLFQRLRDRLGF